MRKTAALLLSLALAAPAAADVTVKYKAASGGMRGIGAFESSGTRSLSGLKSREDANMRFTGAILGRVGGKKGRDSVEIVRVDLDKRWALNAKKKTYRESAIALKPSAAEKEKDDEEESSAPGEEQKPTHRVKSAEASVKKTGEARTINGFKASRYAGLLKVVIEELETKKTSEFRMESDVWTTPWTKDLRAAVAEEGAFAKAYLKKLGENLPPQDQQRFGFATAKALMGAAGPEVSGALAKMKAELDKIEGYPVLTETAWRVPSEDADKAEMDAEMDEDSEGVSMSELADGGAEKAVAGFFGGIAKRAAKKKAKEKLAPKAGAPAYSVRTEVLSVSAAKVAPEAFEIPAGYKKKF